MTVQLCADWVDPIGIVVNTLNFSTTIARFTRFCGKQWSQKTIVFDSRYLLGKQNPEKIAHLEFEGASRILQVGSTDQDLLRQLAEQASSMAKYALYNIKRSGVECLKQVGV